jgi:hypothetical protein
MILSKEIKKNRPCWDGKHPYPKTGFLKKNDLTEGGARQGGAQ